jgi:cofilin
VPLAIVYCIRSNHRVAVSDEAVSAFNELKLRKTNKFIIYKVNDDKTEIVVAETSNAKDYEDFVGQLPENDCRYAVYDFEYDTPSGEGKRSKLVFYTWSPDTAPIKSKMIYASSKDAIRRSLNGVSTEVQGTDFSEVDYNTVLEKVSRGAGSH